MEETTFDLSFRGKVEFIQLENRKKMRNNNDANHS